LKTILSAVLVSGLGICLLHGAQFLYWSSLCQGGIANMTIPADGIAQFPARSRGYFDKMMKLLDGAAALTAP